MMEQMPAKVKIPGGATLIVGREADPNCTLCEGQGFTQNPGISGNLRGTTTNNSSAGRPDA
jgi:hypothetical protein